MMNRRSFAIAGALAFSAPVLAQQGGAPQRYYARAHYTKWKPGMQAEGQTFLKDIPYKASLNSVTRVTRVSLVGTVVYRVETANWK